VILPQNDLSVQKPFAGAHKLVQVTASRVACERASLERGVRNDSRLRALR